MHLNRVVATLALAVFITTARHAVAQGTFQNLDFESGVFVPIPGKLNTVQWGPAMPWWTGYLGNSPIDWILHNDLFLSNPGISIMGPDYPTNNALHGHYYIQLQNAFPPSASSIPALAQVGTLPIDARSIRFLSYAQYAIGLGVYFAGNQIPLYHLGSLDSNREIWGGDISAFAGQTGELRFRGNDYLDDIQFSSQPIPEPGSLALFAAGFALLIRRRFPASVSDRR